MKPIALGKALASLGLSAALLIGVVKADELSDLTAAAQRGDANAQATLGKMYADGKRVPRDDAQAIIWLRKAADQGNTSAEFDLAFMYINGRGGRPEDNPEVVTWNRKAADQGVELAQVNMGLMYLSGLGVKRDEAQAAEWFRRSADYKYPLAEIILGALYETGRGVPKDDNSAAEWYSKVSQQQHGTYTQQDPAGSLAWLRHTAGQGGMLEQFILARIYDAIPHDLMDTASWYRRAAEQGLARAQFHVGLMYAEGLQGPADLEQATTWWRRAADQGDAQARLALGAAYAAGQGIAQNAPEVIAWWKKTAPYIAVALVPPNGFALSMNKDIAETREAYMVTRYNFTLTKLPRPWGHIPKQGGPNQVSLTFSPGDPNKLFIVTASADAAFGATAETMAQEFLATVKASGSTSSEQTPYVVNGLAGIEVDADISHNGDKGEMITWMASVNGYRYFLALIGKGKRADLRVEARLLFANFHQIDPAAVADGYPISASARYASPGFPFRVDLDGAGWRMYTSAANVKSVAEYIAVNMDVGATMGVFPIDLRGMDPSVDALAEALLDLVNMTYGDLPHRLITQDGYSGIEADYQGAQGGTNGVSRLRVVKAGGAAYLIMVTLPLSQISHRDEIFAQLDHVHLLHDTLVKRQISDYPEHARRRHAKVFYALGRYYFRNKQFQASLDQYRTSFDFTPDDPVILAGVLSADSWLGHYAEGLADVESHLTQFSDNYDLLTYRGYFLQKLGRSAEAIETYRKAFSSGRRDDEDFALFVNLLWETGDKEGAIKEATTAAKNTDRVRIKRLVGDLYLKAEDYNRAVDAYTQVRQLSPYDMQTIYGLMESYYRLDRQHEVLALGDELTAKGYDTADVHFYRGRSEYALKWYPQAKKSFERALAMNPTDQVAKNYLDHVSGMLGEGDNSGIKLPIEPIPLPTFIKTKQANVPAQGTDAVYFLRARGYQYAAGQARRQTNYYIIKMLSKKGVESFSTFQLPFDPLNEQIFVNELVVKDDQGKIVATGDVSQYYVVDDTAGGVASHLKLLNIPVSGLAVGYTVQLTVSYREMGASDGFSFVEYGMAAPYPIERSAVYVRGDTKKLQWRMPQAASEHRDGDAIGWVMNDVAAYRPESLQEDPQKFLPYAWISEKTSSWEKLGEKYNNDIADRLVISDAVRQVAKEVTADAASKAEKVRLITQYVQSELTYKAIEFGKRGIIPDRAEDILHNRYGDCKDHALLLQQMLTASGIDAKLALVNSARPIEGDFPSLDQFNHMVVYCPGCGENVFLDATDKDLAPIGPVPAGLGGGKALIIAGDSSGLMAIPAYREQDDAISTDRRIQIQANGAAQVQEVVEMRGYIAASFRAGIKGVDASGRIDLIQRTMRSVESGIILKRLDVKNLQDASKPLIMDLEYNIDAQFMPAQHRLVGKMPAVWEHYMLWFDPMAQRDTPFVIRYPLEISTVAHLRGPDGDELGEQVTRNDSDKGDRFLSWKGSMTADKRDVEIRYSAHLHAGHYQPGDYDGLIRELGRTFAFVGGSVWYRE